jgi:hypothetical protein
MTSPSSTDDRDYSSELNEFLAKLSDDPERDQVKSEIEGTIITHKLCEKNASSAHLQI